MGVEVKGICFDSRKVQAGFLFVAVKGTLSDGHQFINKAIDLGATAIVCETLPESIHEQVTFVTVKNSAQALGIIASNYFGNPSEKLKLTGVTGTNGKTTVATLLYQLFGSLGHRAGLISTVEYRVVDQVLPSTHTTPDPLHLNELLHKMVE